MTGTTDGSTVTRVDLATADFRSLTIAGVGALVAAIAVGRLGALLELDPTLTGTVSQATLATAIPLYHYIGRSRGRGILPRGVVPFTGFEMPWPVITVLGAFVIVAAANAASFVGAVLTWTIEGALAASVIGAVVAAFLVGRWIGVRADNHAFLAAVACGLLARVTGSVLDFALAPEAIRLAIGMSLDAEYLALAMVGGTIWALAALAGCVLGRRARESGYVAYLLRRIPDTSRATILELAYDEARQSSASRIVEGPGSRTDTASLP